MHLKRHEMSLADYIAVHGEPTPVKTTYHRCHICQDVILFTRSRLTTHLSKHKVTVRDYGNSYLSRVRSEKANVVVEEVDTNCIFSNDYEDECSTICKICDKTLKYSNIASHLYQTHQTKLKVYVEEFGEPEFSKKSYHECAICHETLLFMRSNIKTHVKIKHNITITSYNRSHMQLHNVEYTVNNMLKDKGRKVGTQKVPQWCDGTMYKCPYCFNIYYRYFTFRIHLINSHKMKDTEERSICVRENELLTDIYRCKICSTQVKRDRMDIEAHLKQAHRLTIKVYSVNFENPRVQESSELTVEKLVRKGLLTEPTRCLNKIPKQIKIKSVGPRSMKKRTLAAAAPPSRTRSRMSSTVERSAGAVAVKTEVEDQSDLSEEDNHPPAVSTFYTDSDTASQENNKRRKRFPSEKLSKLKISHVSSLATESHQQVKVKIEKETTGSSTTVLPPSRS